jgi:dipeptidyl aminopeptidase/acylaminoacyl peptidase
MRAIAFLVALLLYLPTPSWAQESGKSLQPRELLSWKSIESVELSPDGRQVIYSTKEPDWKQNRFVRSIWVAATDGTGEPVPLTASDKDETSRWPSDKDDAPRWAPDGSRIAFLSTRDGAPQIWTVGKPGGVSEKLTNALGGVISFQWSPDSRHIAFIARSVNKGSFEAQRSHEAGVVINKWNFVIYQLLNNQLFLDLDRSTELWLIDVNSRTAEHLVTDGSVSQIAWSPDGQRLAVMIHPATGWFAAQRNDAVIYTLASKKSQVIARGSGGEDFDNTSGYSDPVWAPHGSGLALFFKSMAKRWQARAQLGIYWFDQARFVPVPGIDRLLLYVPKVAWPDRDRMLLENTSRGSRQLFWLSLVDGALTPVGSHHGSESRFSFSRDGKTMAFVRGSTSDAPEVYIAHAPFTSASRLTSLNTPLSDAQLPRFERVHWKSTDGTEVEGWLGKPAGFRPDRKYPLLVIVHGGPGVAVPDDFDMYMEWPYPYRLAALRGYLVLLPNYRGTGSYSAAFSDPHDLAGEPVDDIVTGIEYLIERGFVDSDKVGLAGHSHGGWLGPQVLTTHPKLFRAGSFAEGGLDMISAYGQMPGWLNLGVHDYYYGGSPYGALSRYIALSPIFHVTGLNTPTLLEFGDQSLAPQGLEFQTALWRCGVPSELIIYPKTGHNMSRPAQEAESMARNLDWFDYWMLGKRNASEDKNEQYHRWEQIVRNAQVMRASRDCSKSAPAATAGH